jgi:hypothetical protein
MQPGMANSVQYRANFSHAYLDVTAFAKIGLDGPNDV